MKTHLAAAALAATLTQPAGVVTFPSLTTIYVASGVHDNGGGPGTGSATAVHCTNVSGVSAQVRVQMLHSTAGQSTATVAHGQTAIFATKQVILYGSTSLSTGAILQGGLNVESTQSAVFCSAMELSASATTATGIALHMVGVNPHPGTVEQLRPKPVA